MLAITKKPFFSIIGLPRSGTTILSNIFNSIDNCFCLVEPLLAEKNSRENYADPFKFGHYKLGDIYLAPHEQILPKVLDKLNRHDKLDIGCLKETFRVDNFAYLGPIEYTDFIVVLNRDPLSTFSSWRQTGWGGNFNNPYYFVTNYLSFQDYTRALSKEKRCVNLDYEDLCVGQGQYLIDHMSDVLKLEGEIELKGIGDSLGYGDKEARKATMINEPRMSRPNLTQQEIDLIINTIRIKNVAKGTHQPLAIDRG